jgi:hypothetical protein
MCQVTPFSLPCCGRIYIHVEKVQGCPDNWPKSKCPPEFCIQISGYEAAQVDQRPSGTCWRCQALAKSKSGRQRENMRPGIDRAHIMPGLEELDARDRRREAEIAGKCWFCGSSAGCTACGPKEAAIVPLESLPDRKPKRQAKEAPAGEKPRKSRRKLKVESQTPTRPLKEESVSSSVPDIIEPQPLPFFPKYVFDQPNNYLEGGFPNFQQWSSVESIPNYYQFWDEYGGSQQLYSSHGLSEDLQQFADKNVEIQPQSFNDSLRLPNSFGLSISSGDGISYPSTLDPHLDSSQFEQPFMGLESIQKAPYSEHAEEPQHLDANIEGTTTSLDPELFENKHVSVVGVSDSGRTDNLVSSVLRANVLCMHSHMSS